jgi:alpha-glucosidase (family GH31 glycosyl hydrolase)
MESTFMLGDAIYVTPALLNSSDNYDAYFPKGNWVDLFNLSNIIKSEGAKISLKPQTAQANAYLRPGKIVPYQ